MSVVNLLTSSKLLSQHDLDLGKTFSHECTEFWNFLAPVLVWRRCLLSCRRPIREQLSHEEGISPIITLSYQKPASYEWETFDGFSFINLGGLGSRLGWLRRDVVALLMKYWFFFTWNMQNKADIWSLQRHYFLSEAVYQCLWICSRRFHLKIKENKGSRIQQPARYHGGL